MLTVAYTPTASRQGLPSAPVLQQSSLTQENCYNRKYLLKYKPEALKQSIQRKTRGSLDPLIAHLVFNLTSKVNRKWGCYT